MFGGDDGKMFPIERIQQVDNQVRFERCGENRFLR